MAYVKRDENGLIVAIYARKQPGIAEEFLVNPKLHKPPLSTRKKREKDYEKELDGLWDVIDAVIKAIGGDLTSLNPIKQKIDAIKARHQ